MAADGEELGQTTDRVFRLAQAIDTFLEAFEALDELISALGPHAAQLDSPASAMATFLAELRAVPPDRKPAVTAQMDRMKQEPDFSLFDFVGGLLDEFPDELWVYRIMTEHAKLLRRNRRAEILNRSFITSSVGSFEVLLGAVLNYYYSAHPNALGPMASEKEFSLADLEALGSIEDAKAFIVAKKIDKFLFDSFATWSSWWKKNLGFGFDEIAMSWPVLQELIERRHIIIHNGGRVSQRYRANLNITTEEPSVGFELSVDDDYIDRGISELKVLGILIATLTLIKLDSGSANLAVSKLNDVLYDNLLASNWQAALALANSGLKLRLSADDELIMKVNAWLSRKRMGENIHTEVEQLDCSVLQARYRLALASLRDDLDEAFDCLEDAIRAGELTLQALLEWPVLDELRTDGRFKEVLFDSYEAVRDLDPPRAGKFAEVMASPPGTKFHLPSCRHVQQGAISIPRQAAEKMNLQACGACKP